MFHLGNEKIEPLAHGGRNLLVLPSFMKSQQRHEPGNALDGNVAQRKSGGERLAPAFVRRFA